MGLQRASSSVLAYPPGMGFTPMAASTPTLTRRASFGLGGAVCSTPLPRTSTCGLSSISEDGVIARELFLLFKDGDLSKADTAEDAGFIWPQPGWLRTESNAAAKAMDTAGRSSSQQPTLPASRNVNVQRAGGQGHVTLGQAKKAQQGAPRAQSAATNGGKGNQGQWDWNQTNTW